MVTPLLQPIVLVVVLFTGEEVEAVVVGTITHLLILNLEQEEPLPHT